eukprot:NODE_107_length_1906_cov_1693.185245_g77_i0.p2 GENE.NODE_107_length_1906_cov_1693.185245_g77_i0~~NODE_107_length_1906_cov_1693.185245_g77_i0.p2  ORF type:complete len:547 (-),score=259.85 NODE_107_length_1906_cov_1693.185245_g77_i0:198-1838(-)
MEQGIVEPVEEVGYKNRPPLLEDVSIEGPTRTPIPHALDTIEQREAIEEDYNWFRYSKFALWWLLFLLALFATVFVMTAFEQVGSIHDLRDGIPTYFQLSQGSWITGMEGSDDDSEGHMDKDIRNCRIATVWLCFVGAFVAMATLFMKPRPTLRKIIHYLCVLLIFAGMVMAWVSFGLAEHDTREARRCPEMALFTNEKCDEREGVATGALALDFFIAITAFSACAIMAYTVTSGDFKLLRIGWRQQERDAETEGLPKNPHNIKAHKQRSTRMWLTAIFLVAVMLLCIAQAVMIVVLHQDHNTVTLRSFRGRTNRSFDQYSNRPFEEAGWSARNTRLRYALGGIGILTILLNLVPWRSRVIAYVFAFIYFICIPLACVAFALDVDELRDARHIHGCPRNWFQNIRADLPVLTNASRDVNCINAPYVAMAIIDFFLIVALIIYLVCEYIVRYKSIHSQRKYPWHQIKKIESELDSRRPVRCEITSEVMTAAEYYYRHRFLTEGEMLAKSTAAPEFTPQATVMPYAPAIAPPMMYEDPNVAAYPPIVM